MKAFYFLLSMAIFVSCSGNLEQNRTKLDKVYGKCDNPSRTYTSKQYKQCLAEENAKGESLFGLKGDLNDLISGKNKEITYQPTVNKYLWNGALDMANAYPLKIADNQGGIIETDWINDGNSKRCLIRIRILSNELISNGVFTKFICETKIGDVWKKDEKDLINEEKQFTLKILEKANILKNTNL